MSDGRIEMGIGLGLLLAAWCCGCANPAAWKPETFSHGAAFVLDGQDAGDLDAELDATAKVLGVRDFKGAGVIFVDDAAHECGIRDVAGCYLSDLDLALVEKRATVRETALAHELTHRHMRPLLDPNHTHDIWKRITRRHDGLAD